MHFFRFLSHRQLCLLAALGSLALSPASAPGAQYPPTDHRGADLFLTHGDVIWGRHTGIRTFYVPEGTTVTVQAYDGADKARGRLEIHATQIHVGGTIAAVGAGYTGSGGAGGNGPYRCFASGRSPEPVGAGEKLFPRTDETETACEQGPGGERGYGAYGGSLFREKPDGSPGRYRRVLDAVGIMGTGGNGGAGGEAPSLWDTIGGDYDGAGGGGGGCGGGTILLRASQFFVLGPKCLIITDGAWGANAPAGGSAGGNAVPAQEGLGTTRNVQIQSTGGQGEKGHGGDVVLSLPAPSETLFGAGARIQAARSSQTATTSPLTGGIVKFLYQGEPSSTAEMTIDATRIEMVPRRSVAEDTFEPGPASTGWIPMGENTPGRITLQWDQASGSLRTAVSRTAASNLRVSGWMTESSQWIPADAVSSESVVRAKFAVYRTGQENMNDLNQIPSARFRVANRFAVTSLLELYPHSGSDLNARPFAAELRPSSVATSPSIYRVDLDPIEVPALRNPGEGFLRGFEAYAVEPQENGTLALAESSIATYPLSYTPATTTSPATLLKVYAPDATGAGNLSLQRPDTSLTVRKLVAGSGPGAFPTIDFTSGGMPTCTEGTFGVTLDSGDVSPDRIGIASAEFDPGTSLTTRVRVEAESLYRIRFHVTSTQRSTLNAMMRLRARSVKFQWTHKLEIGGAQAASSANNLLAAQSLPGIGCQNPDQRTPGEAGGWYTLLFHSPLSPDIRSDVAGPLAARMPVLYGQPGPGIDRPSMRDLKIGFDLIDTLSNGPGRLLERGNFTLDRVEIRRYPFVYD